MLEERKSLRSPSTKEEEAAKIMCDKLTLIPFPPAHLRSRRQIKSKMKFSQRRTEGSGEGVFKIWAPGI